MLVSAPAAAPDPLPFTDAAGSWRGFLTRPDTGTRHAVGLTLKLGAVQGRAAGSIDYPGRGCGGQLSAVALS